MTELFFSFSLAVWLTALFLASVLTYFSYRITNPPLGRLKKAFLIGLRFLAFCAIFLMIIEPLFVWIGSREIEPKVVILWDNSQSMSLDDKLGDREAVLKEIDNSKTVSIIRSSHDVEEYIFSDSIEKRNNEFTFEGEATALGDAISYFRRNDDETPIGAMIIVSDGQANAGEDHLGASYRSGFPIYTIGIGDPTPPRDISVRQVTAQKQAFVGQNFPVIATISANSYGGLETSINLYLEDKKIGEKRISLPRNGEFLDVKFNVMPENEGEFTYRAFLPATDGELSSSNNARSVCVKVLPSKKSILLIGSKPNWEMTFLLRTLAQDPDIVVKSAFLGKASPASETKMPKTLDELSKNDAVYIIDAINQLDGMNLAPLLLDYVNGGGALGFQFLGNIILNKSSGNTWAKMFPFIYSAGSHVWMEDDFVPEVTVRGLAHSITRPQNETSLKVEDYQRIPPLSGFTMITGNTPGSEILMAHPKMDDVPILSVREVGRGRTMIINGAGFWRWAFVPLGFGKDNDLYRGLVNRSSSWLLAAGEGSDFAVETDKQVYRSGEKVIITARLRDQSNQSLEGAKIATKFTSKDNSSDSMVIVLEDRGDGIYSLELPAFDIGRWVINSVASLNEQSINTANYSFLVEPYSIELENVQLNTIALKAIADATGGKFFLPENIDSLDDYIQTPKLVHKERRERDIWDHPVLLIIFVLLLCAEWILRKKWDLP